MIRLFKRTVERLLTWLGSVLCILLFVCAASGQTVECPIDKVCISPEAARKALADSDTVDVQKKEIAVQSQAIADLKKLLDDMRIQYAAASGELTALKQNAVSDRAIIDLLLKNTRKKCLPLTICL